MQTETGNQIVDWLMEIAADLSMPKEVRDDARRKLRDCALRQPEQTVEDVVGPKH